MFYAYDSKFVTVSLGGVPLSGFSDADKITLAPLEDEVVEYVGSDSEVTISYTNNPVYRATITLAQSSQSNDYLDSLCQARATFSFQTNDLNGTSLVVGLAWIFRAPDLSFAKASGTRAWQLGVQVTTIRQGGNRLAIPIG